MPSPVRCGIPIGAAASSGPGRARDVHCTALQRRMTGRLTAWPVAFSARVARAGHAHRRHRPRTRVSARTATTSMSSRRNEPPHEPGLAGPASVPRTHPVGARAERTLMCDGHRWLVYEHTRAFDRRSRPDLVFESEAVVRRVRNYPTDWLKIDEAKLCEVCRGR